MQTTCATSCKNCTVHNFLSSIVYVDCCGTRQHMHRQKEVARLHRQAFGSTNGILLHTKAFNRRNVVAFLMTPNCQPTRLIADGVHPYWLSLFVHTRAYCSRHYALQHSCWMVQGSSSWPLWVDATDLCCLRDLMMRWWWWLRHSCSDNDKSAVRRYSYGAWAKKTTTPSFEC